MKQVAVVGAGLIGRGWAIVFARADCEVALYDTAPGAVKRALEAIDVSLRDLERIGLIDSAATVRSHMRPCITLGEALDGAAYVQESVPENREIKSGIFAEMDAAAGPDAVLGSSCSAMPGTLFLEQIPGRERCLIAHPANPPYLMPVVELVPTPWTSSTAIESCRSLMEDVGQVPVLLKKEVEGFVMNRMQAAVVNEAMHLVADGVMSPEDVDKTMRYSIGLRWSFMGPFETMDLNAPEGFKDYAHRYRRSYESMGALLRVADPWEQDAIDQIETMRRGVASKEKVADRQAWRDRRLMALLAHMAAAENEIGK
jgi:3-hydroxyacyl-CoA dehydrogenase